jgi:hypothetical protein
MKRAPVELTPIPGDKPEVGIFKSDLTRLGAKKGDWIGVKYNRKSISAEVREVDKSPNFHDHLIWINKAQRDKLELPDISENDPLNPPKNIELTVWKHTLPRNPLLYLAVATFLILAMLSVMQTFVQAGIFPQYKTQFGLGLLALSIISAGITAYGVYSQRQ